MDILRTPDDRFDGLVGWGHDPIYTQVDGLRLARVEAGPRAADAVVLVHGEPTWGYLWRHVVDPLVEAGHRVVVPDQVGFGRSDKPAARSWFTYDRLVESFAAHMHEVTREGPVTLVVHDWGGVVGLRWAVEHADDVARLVLLNTGLWASGGSHSEAWKAFRRYVEAAEALPVADMVDGGSATSLADDVRAAYEAPFPEAAYQAGVLALPLLVPTDDGDPGAAAMDAARRRLSDWTAPTYILWGADDPILPPRIGERFARDIPGAAGVDTVAAMHFLQEDAGTEVGRRIAGFIGAVPADTS